jgi:single-stranded DNA-binding protein
MNRSDQEKQYINHWRIIGTIIEPPKEFPALGTEPASMRCIIQDDGNPDHHITLRWDDPAEWDAVAAELHEGNRVYVEGALQLSVFTPKGQGRTRKSILFNVVRRWQVEPPDNALNELVLVGRLRYAPAREYIESADRLSARLVIEWPEEKRGKQRYTVAQAYLYDDLADEALLAMEEGDMVFVVGLAYRHVWEEEGKHRVVVQAFEAGIGIENEERLWQTQMRLHEPAGQI